MSMLRRFVKYDIYYTIHTHQQWLSYSAVAITAATHFHTTPSIINWLSTSFFFAFVAASPLAIIVLQRGGPQAAIRSAAVLLLLGNWIRYAGTYTTSLAVTIFGQLLIGLAQPLALSAPTQYSELWFTTQGRVSATAIMSLANPLGGALGQLINPFLATSPAKVSNMVLYVALIATVSSLPSFLVPARPPTPASPVSTQPSLPLRQALRLLWQSSTFWFIALPFWIYVGFFNSISSLLAQILTPYGFSETEAGLAGAVLILVGLLSAAITSPVVDRTKAYLSFIKTLVPIIALSYLAFIWAPGTRNLGAPFVIMAVLGAASFSLVPIALEFLAEITHPAGPAATSTSCWAGGQLLGAVFILISDALKADDMAFPPFNMSRALIFQGVLAFAIMPCPMMIGWIFRLPRHGR